MRVCAAFGKPSDLRTPMAEYRLDVFGKVPEWAGKDDIVTLCGHDISEVPKDFPGLVDGGETEVEGFRCIRSYHDFEKTPDADAVRDMLTPGGQEVSKGAFMVHSLKDLHSIFTASQTLGRKHVLLGMGELGAITRIRQRILGNEFTFGYVGEPTAPGQFSAEEMEALGDDCHVIGILGHPLGHSLSPKMHTAAMGKAGINGIYLRFDTPSLEHLDEVIEEYDIRGMNVTIPYKQDVISYLDSTTELAMEVGAVNTIVNRDGKLSGDNTDVAGIVHAFDVAGTPLKDMKVLIIGSGGASRAAAYACVSNGCDTYMKARNPQTSGKVCADFGLIPTVSEDLSAYDAIINCTPVGMDGGSDYPVDITTLRKGQTVLDMVYNRPTVLAETAKAKGCAIAPGIEMLIGQGAESFRRWFDIEPDIEAMREAVS